MKKKIILDAIFNITAVAIPIIVLQLLILPYILKLTDSFVYGKIISIYSFTLLFSLPIGNTLNNVRLLISSEVGDGFDIEKNIDSDFNYLLIIMMLVNFIISVFGVIYYQINFLDSTLIILFSTLNILREYFVVDFRLNLNFKKILYNNICLAFGYIVGFLMFIITRNWPWIFLIGNLSSMIYIFFNVEIIKFYPSKSSYFPRISKQNFTLLISTIFKNSFSYLDKIILLPLLGSNSVSIYYASTIIGKIISMFISPISMVILSHLIKVKRISKKNTLSILLFSLFLFIFGYLILSFIGSPILRILYKETYQLSKELLPLTNSIALLTLITSLLNPLLLRFTELKYQLYINFSSLIIYVLASTLLLKNYELIGFTWGILISNLFKLIFMLIIILNNANKKEEQ